MKVPKYQIGYTIEELNRKLLKKEKREYDLTNQLASVQLDMRYIKEAIKAKTK